MKSLLLIVVVPNQTVAVASKYTTNVVYHEWMGFGLQKNYAFSLAKGDWIISIDADEEITPGLRDEILELLKAPGEYTALCVPLKNYIGNYWVKYGSLFHNYPDYQRRVFHRTSGKCNANLVHEGLVTTGAIKYLNNPVVHRSYETLAECRKSLRYYARLKAIEIFEMKRFSLLIGLLEYPIHIIFTFISYYILKKGFLMGWLGLRLVYEQVVYVIIKYGLALYWRITGRKVVDLKPGILNNDRT